jgi:hypothetical protein
MSEQGYLNDPPPPPKRCYPPDGREKRKEGENDSVKQGSKNLEREKKKM